jgi:hypothetical protein
VGWFNEPLIFLELPLRISAKLSRWLLHYNAFFPYLRGFLYSSILLR